MNELKFVSFEDDLKNEILKQYSYLGIKPPSFKNLREFVIDYLTINKKMVNPLIRKVLISPDLEEKMKGHPKEGVLLEIKERFEKGMDVNRFQSARLFQPKFHDHLLYEWKIFHFHLSNKLHKNGRFVRRTDSLLFVFVDDDQAIFLDIENHKPGIFGDIRWIKILDEFFPEVIKPFLHEEHFSSDNISSLDRQTLWDKGYTLGTTLVNGKVYSSPGVGRMTSGHSAVVVHQANTISRWLYEARKYFTYAGNDISLHHGLSLKDAEYHVRIRDSLEIIELNSGKIVLSFPQMWNFEVD